MLFFEVYLFGGRGDFFLFLKNSNAIKPDNPYPVQ